MLPNHAIVRSFKKDMSKRKKTLMFRECAIALADALQLINLGAKLLYLVVTVITVPVLDQTNVNQAISEGISFRILSHGHCRPISLTERNSVSTFCTRTHQATIGCSIGSPKVPVVRI